MNTDVQTTSTTLSGAVMVVGGDFSRETSSDLVATKCDKALTALAG